MNTEQEAQTDLRPFLEAELQRLRSTAIGQRITAIEILLAGDGAGPTLVERRPEAPAPNGALGRRRQSVSKIKLDMIQGYMERHRRARQVDVARDLEENSGNISVGLRQLQEQGLVELVGVERKSKVWIYTGPVPEGSDRTTIIKPGEGIEEGRKR